MSSLTLSLSHTYTHTISEMSLHETKRQSNCSRQHKSLEGLKNKCVLPSLRGSHTPFHGSSVYRMLSAALCTVIKNHLLSFIITHSYFFALWTSMSVYSSLYHPYCSFPSPLWSVNITGQLHLCSLIFDFFFLMTLPPLMSSYFFLKVCHILAYIMLYFSYISEW